MADLEGAKRLVMSYKGPRIQLASYRLILSLL